MAGWRGSVRDVVVIDISGSDGEKFLCAYIVPSVEIKKLKKGDTRRSGVSDSANLTNELKGFLAGVLPDYMVPGYFVFLEKIPLNANGKLNRKALPPPDMALLKQNSLFTPPGSEIEIKLVEIWSTVLDIPAEQISVNDNFFHLGGHSLKATRLSSRIHKRFDIFLSLSQVFSAPTIRELALTIGEIQKQEFHTVDPAEKKEYYPLTSPQNTAIMPSGYIKTKRRKTPPPVRFWRMSSWTCPSIFPGRRVRVSRATPSNSKWTRGRPTHWSAWPKRMMSVFIWCCWRFLTYFYPNCVPVIPSP
ncbi:MAG: hypothetical protein GY757_51790 [bacterium]|nr:hypothetical protein [bacterium]